MLTEEDLSHQQLGLWTRNETYRRLRSRADRNFGAGSLNDGDEGNASTQSQTGSSLGRRCVADGWWKEVPIGWMQGEAPSG